MKRLYTCPRRWRNCADYRRREKPRTLEESEGDPNRERSRWRGEGCDLTTQGEAIGETNKSVRFLEIRSTGHEPEQDACPHSIHVQYSQPDSSGQNL